MWLTNKKTGRPFNTDWLKDKQIERSKEEGAKLTGSTTSSFVKFRQIKSTEFHKSIDEAKNSRPEADRWRVDVHDAKDYDDRECKLFVTAGGSTVAVDKDGDIISVCRKSGDVRGVGAELLAEAVRNGGVKLDSFGGNHKFYTSNGFEPVSWTPFNEQYAPPGWKDSGCGKEEVIFYRYVGKGNVKYTDKEAFLRDTKPFTGDDGYDNAQKYRDSQIRRKK